MYCNSFIDTGSLFCLFNYCASLPAITPWPGGWLAEWAALIWHNMRGRVNWQLSDKMMTLHLLYNLHNTVIICFSRHFYGISTVHLIFIHLLNPYQKAVYCLAVKVFTVLSSYFETEFDNCKKFKLILQKFKLILQKFKLILHKFKLILHKFKLILHKFKLISQKFKLILHKFYSHQLMH